MIYTSYDMIRDCRAGRAAGWSYFIANYVPVVRRILAHYVPDSADQLLEPVLRAVRQAESSLFASMEPSPERWFVAELRQQVLAAAEAVQSAAKPEIPVDLETVATALEGLTLAEKQAAWLESMRYDAPQTGVLLRMDPKTVEKIRSKAAEALRGKVDTWNRRLMADNGRELGRAAAAARSAECLPAKAFLDVIDGRTTWRGREEMEQHVHHCWQCIDHFCRMAEVAGLLRGNIPLPEQEVEAWRQRLGVSGAKRGGWKRFFGATGR